MSEQLLNKIFEKLLEIDDRLAKVEQSVNTSQSQIMDELDAIRTELKADIVALDTRDEKGFDDVINMTNLLGVKMDNINKTMSHHANMLDVLATRTTHQEAEIKGLKIAK